MYEVEIKVELTDAERQALISEAVSRGFASQGVTPQNDYYVEAVKSAHDIGYDIKRYRNEAGTYIYTRKVWEMLDGQPIRREDEHEVTQEEFDDAVAAHPDAVKIIKDREWFEGSHQGTPISLTIDSVKFDHSPALRYFVEAEISVADAGQVAATRQFLEDFLKEVLGREEIVVANGMFRMAFEGL